MILIPKGRRGNYVPHARLEDNMCPDISMYLRQGRYQIYDDWQRVACPKVTGEVMHTPTSSSVYVDTNVLMLTRQSTYASYMYCSERTAGLVSRPAHIAARLIGLVALVLLCSQSGHGYRLLWIGFSTNNPVAKSGAATQGQKRRDTSKDTNCSHDISPPLLGSRSCPPRSSRGRGTAGRRQSVWPAAGAGAAVVNFVGGGGGGEIKRSVRA